MRPRPPAPLGPGTRRPRGTRLPRNARPAPGPVVLSDGATELDLHPLVFAGDGSARQAADDRGATFSYPADCFGTGRIAGAEVPCISAAQQVFFHQGYVPQPHGLADMRALRETSGVDTHF
ncbi:nucleotidyltransferase domain-containing protein [Amycolatopsis australiensis]|uniref:nucleotidyltransferase domain-containing protein n=1 Tax=Amycolatopsis australiensis TaxID=546364 RepID=UPI003CCC36BD